MKAIIHISLMTGMFERGETLKIEKKIPVFLRENDGIVIHDFHYSIARTYWNTDRNQAMIYLEAENLDPETWAAMKAGGWK